VQYLPLFPGSAERQVPHTIHGSPHDLLLRVHDVPKRFPGPEAALCPDERYVVYTALENGQGLQFEKSQRKQLCVLLSDLGFDKLGFFRKGLIAWATPVITYLI
jgi:hypothetical protein